MPASPSADRPPHVAVVGGGIAGLAAAWRLHEAAGDTVRVTVLEGSPALGGKLRRAELAGVTVDVGAESMLARRPEGTTLARAVGLGDALVSPATAAAAVWARGALRPLPAGLVMGVPSDLLSLARSGILSPAGFARAAAGALLPHQPLPDDDVTVGAFLRDRLGREVVDRLVEPLIGGVYAGHADRLSLSATLPQIVPAARRGLPPIAVARRLRRSGARAGPVFAGVAGGVGRLPGAVAAASRAEIRLGVAVREIRRTAQGWHLRGGATSATGHLDADAVILAVPARPAARLLADVAPAAAADLAAIDYASVAVVTLALRRQGTQVLRGSGFLVPPGERARGRTLTVKAATYSTRKWAWVVDAAPDLMLVRMSVGRHGEEADLQRDDADLMALAGDDLAAITGAQPAVVEGLVTRWGGALPQYAAGHVARVARVRAAVAGVPGLAVCGAAYDGVGIPACVASGYAAADDVLAALAAGRRERQ